MPTWVEIAADYRCNNRCVGCFSVSDSGPSMTSVEVGRALTSARSRGARHLWIGGGEPTMRRDLVPIVAAAKRLGFERVKLQTNAMLLSYPALVDALAAAGLGEVNVSIKGANAARHDALAKTPGCFDLAVRGLAECRRAGIALEGDILACASNVGEIPDMVREFYGRGVERFNVWALSAVDDSTADVVAEVPRLEDVAAGVVGAMDLGLSSRADFVTSLHTPACFVPETHDACLFHAPDLDLLVANPDGHAFLLQDSPMEGGTYLDVCASCTSRPRCTGMRADYLRVHGAGAMRPRRAPG